MQFLPVEYLWLEPVLFAVALVFVADLIGNMLAFGNRIVNALVTALIFGAMFAAIMHFNYAKLSIAIPTP